MPQLTCVRRARRGGNSPRVNLHGRPQAQGAHVAGGLAASNDLAGAAAAPAAAGTATTGLHRHAEKNAGPILQDNAGYLPDQGKADCCITTWMVQFASKLPSGRACCHKSPSSQTLSAQTTKVGHVNCAKMC